MLVNCDIYNMDSKLIWALLFIALILMDKQALWFVFVSGGAPVSAEQTATMWDALCPGSHQR